MSVVVEVPDEATSKLAKRLIGRRSGVTVSMNGEAQSGAKRGSAAWAGSDAPRRIIVGIADSATPRELLEMLQDGVWAVLPADEDALNDQLRSCVDQVRVGLSPLLSSIAGDRDEVGQFLEVLRASSTPRRGRARPNSNNPLSDREVQILQRIAQGVTSREIADEMGFQLQTVKNKVTTILTKSEARSRTHAVSIALRNGWIDPG